MTECIAICRFGPMLTSEERAELRERIKARSHGGYRPNKLTLGQREALVRSFLEGESPVALARRYGITRQTVDYHLKRAAQVGG